MVIVVPYIRGSLRDIALPLTTTISEDIGTDDVLRVIKRFKDIIGAEILKKLNKAFDEALENEIYQILNTDNLECNFPILAEKFWARIALPLIDLNTIIYTPDMETLRKLIEIEEELAKAMTKMIRNSGYNYADDLIYALSILVDHDLWVLDKVSKLGLDNLIKKFIDRAPDTLLHFSSYMIYLIFTWIASTATTLGIVKKYNEKNRDTLAKWCRKYAEDIDNYLDTLDLLLDDEAYEDLIKLGIIKR